MQTKTSHVFRLVLAACLTALLACTVVERKEEVHSVHLIDSGSAINNGLKIVSEGDIEVAVFMDGKQAFLSNRRLNGMYVVTPDRYLDMATTERTFIAYLAAHGSDSPQDTAIRAELDRIMKTF